MGFDIKTTIGGLILWIGINSTPSEILAGICISLIVYTVSVVILSKRLGWRLVIGCGLTIIMAIGLALVYPGLPYLNQMPVQGAMSFSGVLSALVYPKKAPGAKISWIEAVVKRAIENKINKTLK